MVFWILISTTFICFLTYFYVIARKRLNYFRDLGIPHLPPTIFFGNMRGPVSSQQHMGDLAKSIYNVNLNAKYVGAYNFMEPVIALRDLDLAKEVVQRLDRSRKRDGERDLRRRTFGFVKPKMFELTLKKKDILVEYIEKMVGTEIDAKDLFGRYNNDLQASFAFGLEVDSLNDPDNEFYRQAKDSCRLVGITKTRYFMSNAFPSLGVKSTIGEATKYFSEVVRRQVDQVTSSWPSVVRRLSSKVDDEAKLARIAYGVFFAGFETTAGMLAFLARELALRPEVQGKLQDEIDETLRKDGEVTFDDIDAMPYLDAVVNECLRRRSATCPQRRSDVTFELPPALPGHKPYIVEAGMNIWIPLAGIHSDPKLFKNPEEFDPERFVGDDGSRAAASVTFGLGSKSCPGKQLALFNMKVTLFYVLAEFGFAATEKTKEAVRYDPRVLPAQPLGGVWLRFERRVK